MDVLFLQMLLHVLKIHPPDAVLVLHQRGMHGLVAVVLQAHREADVSGAVDQDLVAAGADAVQRTDDAAQHTILVADVFRLQAGDAVALLMPPDDAVEIRIRGLKIAEGRVFCTLNDGFLDGGHGGEVHVGHPHRDSVKARLRGAGEKPSPFRPSTAMASLPRRSRMEVKSYFISALLLKNFVWPHLNTFGSRMQPPAGKLKNRAEKSRISTIKRSLPAAE